MLSMVNTLKNDKTYKENYDSIDWSYVKKEEKKK